ncbi:MAG: hypothetical protein EA390_05830 [Balneolaceae bacterium]|nr:MAG: hypothetical protein EA390_05830 [Balneolaceae bacterium]
MNAIEQLKIQSGVIVRKSTIPLAIIISFGFLFFACNEMQNPVSELPVIESFAIPGASAIGVNDTEPVTIQDFKITFKGNSYDPVANTSTFKYTVTRNSSASGFNYMAFEIPECAAGDYAGHTPSESSSVTDNEIRWTSSIGTGSSRTHTVTYNGKKTTGMIDATIQGSGSGDIQTELIPGPCKGVYSISGTVYVDEDGSGGRDDSREGGIDNVTVRLDVNDKVATQKTSSNGTYTFNIYIGGEETGFTLSVPEKTADITDFNELLYDTYTPTEGDGGISDNISSPNLTGNNFGFEPKTDEIIQKFDDGNEIRLKTEVPSFWANEIKFADKGRRTVFIKSELENFLDKIDELDLTYKFNFGTDVDERLKKAEEILTLKRRSTELEVLRANLLAAKLNVVSGNGAFDENDNVLTDFNLIILKTGSAAAVTLDPPSTSGFSLMMNSTTYETHTFTTTSSSTKSSGDLLLSFNGGGGGLGSN